MTATARAATKEPTYQTPRETVQTLREEARDLAALLDGPAPAYMEESGPLRSHIRELIATIHANERANRPRPIMADEERAREWNDAHELRMIALWPLTDGELLAIAERLTA